MELRSAFMLQRSQLQRGRARLAAPLNLTPGTVTETSVALSWDAYTGATGFKIYYSETAGFDSSFDGAEFMPSSCARLQTLLR